MLRALLQFFWILLPALLVGGFEFVRHEWLPPYPLWLGNLWAAGLALLASALYYWATYRLVESLAEKVQVERQKQAALAEREQIGRELHDSVSQSLFFINVELGKVRELVEQGRAGAALGLLDEVQGEVQATYQDVRSTIHSLTRRLAEEPLIPALEKRVVDFRRRTGIRTELAVGVDPPLPALAPAAREKILGIVQEALQNVYKHAGARQVNVTVRRAGRGLEIRVEDDGVGFDPGRVAGGFGLEDMRRRAVELGGRLTVEAKPGGGTTVLLRLGGDAR